MTLRSIVTGSDDEDSVDKHHRRQTPSGAPKEAKKKIGIQITVLKGRMFWSWLRNPRARSNNYVLSKPICPAPSRYPISDFF